MGKRIITLGTWNGKPIEWMVINETEKAMFLFSLYVLNYNSIKFDNSNSHNKWIKSDVRKYLSEKFNTMFNQEEIKLIINCCLSDCDNSKDNIFLLSVEEAKKYLTEDERKTVNQSGWYWLRSPSPHQNNDVAYVWDTGIINDNYVNGCHAESGCNGSCGIRPAIMIRKETK